MLWVRKGFHWKKCDFTRRERESVRSWEDSVWKSRRCKTTWFFRELQLSCIDENVWLWRSLVGEGSGASVLKVHWRGNQIREDLALSWASWAVVAELYSGSDKIRLEGALWWWCLLMADWSLPSWRVADQLYLVIQASGPEQRMGSGVQGQEETGMIFRMENQPIFVEWTRSVWEKVGINAAILP